MADLERMIESARRAMVEVLELKPSDRVLVVRDPQCQKCSEAFFEAARVHGCDTTAYVLPNHGRPLKAMPEDMAATVEGQDVVINVMSGSSDEVPFRIEWLTLLEERGLRVGHSPNIHEDMMDGGPMDSESPSYWTRTPVPGPLPSWASASTRKRAWSELCSRTRRPTARLTSPSAATSASRVASMSRPPTSTISSTDRPSWRGPKMRPNVQSSRTGTSACSLGHRISP